MGRIKIGVGKLHCGKLRNFLNECKFDGLDIDFIESKGFLSNDFLIKGDDEDMQKVYDSIEDFRDKVGG